MLYRLTFWLSKKSPPLTCVGEKENLVAFVSELEKAEAWIFARIIESLWWQVLFNFILLFEYYMTPFLKPNTEL